MFPPPPGTPTLPVFGDTRYEHAADAICGVAATAAVARTSSSDTRIRRERAGACCESGIDIAVLGSDVNSHSSRRPVRRPRITAQTPGVGQERCQTTNRWWRPDFAVGTL